MKSKNPYYLPTHFFPQLLVVAAVFLSAGGSAWAQQFSFSTVALTGQPAPGTGAGVTYSGFFNLPTLNAVGQSAFVASVTGVGVSTANDTGLWSGAPGGVTLLAREGNPAPGTAAGVTYSVFGAPVLNAAGQSAFLARVAGAGVTSDNDTGSWLGVPGSVALLAREGDPAPGTPAGVTYSIIGLSLQPTINAAGQSAFFALIAGPGVTTANDGGLWSGAPGSVALLQREGDSAPGTPAGVNFVVFQQPTLNAAGQSSFLGNISGPGVTGTNNDGIWSGAPGSVTLVAREGDPAPGTGTGPKYLGLDIPTLNSAGQNVFGAGLTGPGTTGANNGGLWVGAPGSVTLLVRTGDPAPGTGAGVNYASMGAPTLNAAGQSAFIGFLTGSGVTAANDTGLWSGGPGSLAKIVREGEAAPGTSAGTLFGDISNFFARRFAHNDRGDVVFWYSLTGPDVTSANDGSLWFANAGGTLFLIVREGDPFEVAPGDTRTVSTLSFRGGSGDEDGFPCGLNDLGQVVFYASFTDGSSGIFIATPLALQVTGSVSRKMHGALGPFDIPLPLTGAPGVECRSAGGNHTLVFAFNNDVLSGSASVTDGTGSVAGSPSFAGNTMTVNLTGVADVQQIKVTLSGVTDEFSQTLLDTAVSMNVLVGDTTGNKAVNSSDVSQTKLQSGVVVSQANCRQDVTVNGVINSSDVSLVKLRSGSAIP